MNKKQVEKIKDPYRIYFVYVLVEKTLYLCLLGTILRQQLRHLGLFACQCAL